MHPNKNVRAKKEAKAGQLIAERYERTTARKGTRAGHYTTVYQR